MLASTTVGEDDAIPDVIDALVEDDEPGPEPQEESMKEGKIAGVREPGVPSAADIAEHNLAHAHYRSWCPVCVAARGVSDSHFKQPDRTERTLSTICADYCFLRRDHPWRVRPRRRKTKMTVQKDLQW